jgi:hypothetical protein
VCSAHNAQHPYLLKSHACYLVCLLRELRSQANLHGFELSMTVCLQLHSSSVC